MEKTKHRHIVTALSIPPVYLPEQLFLGHYGRVRSTEFEKTYSVMSYVNEERFG